MITAVDSNVLIDILTASSTFGIDSRDALRQSHSEGDVVACEVVWAEVAGYFQAGSGGHEMSQLGVEFRAMDAHTAAAAGQSWRLYRKRGGTRQRVLADFLIGAHALHAADRLLTRDRGFYRAYFADLPLLVPGA